MGLSEQAGKRKEHGVQWASGLKPASLRGGRARVGHSVGQPGQAKRWGEVTLLLHQHACGLLGVSYMPHASCLLVFTLLSVSVFTGLWALPLTEALCDLGFGPGNGPFFLGDWGIAERTPNLISYFGSIPVADSLRPWAHFRLCGPQFPHL